MCSNRDAMLFSKPYVCYKSLKKMIKTIDEKVGADKKEKMIIGIYDGTSGPSQTEIKIVTNHKMSGYAITEITVVESLRSLGINSLVVSQSLDMTKKSTDNAKDIDFVINNLTSAELIADLENAEKKYLAQIQSMETSYQSAISFGENFRKSYFDPSLKKDFNQVTIVIMSYII